MNLLRTLLVAFALALPAVLPGCAAGTNPLGSVTLAPQTPAVAQRDVFAAKEAFGIAERIATAYAQLPRCKVPPAIPCSDTAVVAQITRARNIARDALAAAQTAVDTPNFGQDVISTALAAMNAGVSAFEAISNRYGSK